MIISYINYRIYFRGERESIASLVLVVCFLEDLKNTENISQRI